MARWAWATALLMAAQSSTVTAKPLSVGEALLGCEMALSGRIQANPTGDDALYCIGVAEGVLITMDLNCDAAEAGFAVPHSLAAELPPSTGAAIQALLNWARENPARWGDGLPSGFVTILPEAFPCSTTR